jgi:hypothetical protein
MLNIKFESEAVGAGAAVSRGFYSDSGSTKMMPFLPDPALAPQYCLRSTWADKVKTLKNNWI